MVYIRVHTVNTQEKHLELRCSICTLIIMRRLLGEGGRGILYKNIEPQNMFMVNSYFLKLKGWYEPSNEYRHNKHLAGLASGCLIRLSHAWHTEWHTLGTRHKLRMTCNDLHPENEIALNNDHNFC